MADLGRNMVASRELEIIREESRERHKFSLIALFRNYHHNAFKFNLIYYIIRNQPMTLRLLQILRFQAHYYHSAPALLLIIQLVFSWCSDISKSACQMYQNTLTYNKIKFIYSGLHI